MFVDTKKVIGSRINEALAFSNKKQKELAARLGVPDNTISYFCSGKRVPNAEQIIEISKFLGVSADFLLGMAKEKTTDPKIQAVCDYTGLSEDAVRELHCMFDSISLQKFFDFEEYEYGIELLKTLSWLISEQYIYEIIEHFSLIKKYSQQYLSFEDEIVNNGLYSVDDETSELNNMVKLQEMEKNIDFERYMLVKLSEKLSNHFDQREQVENNGKHNPSEE